MEKLLNKLLNRKLTNIINWIFDNLLPPILRDSKMFMYIFMYPLFKDKTKYFMSFKDDLSISDEKCLYHYYRLLNNVHLKRKTDLNNKCIHYIIKNITGQKILDIACGTGYLTKKIASLYPDKTVIGIDFNLKNCIKQKMPNLKFLKGSIFNIPYKDNYFDTVICAHTLEHLYNPKDAIAELRRVARKKLIIVLPKQREYKYTFDLHLHYFPYKYSLYIKLGISKEALVSVLDGDYLIVERL